MTTMYIGQILVAKRIERKQKDGTIAYHAQVSLQFETIDKMGEKEISMENIQLPINELDTLKSSVGKYLSIPYTTINTKNGTYTFPDDNLLYRIYDNNPLAQIVETTNQAAQTTNQKKPDK